MRAVRSDRFKYIKNFESEKVSLIRSIPGDIQKNPSYPEWVKHGDNTTRYAEEFYDLKEDPDGLHNLANDPAYAGELEKFRQQMLKAMP